MKKDEWIDGILEAAKNIKPVTSNPYLATRIEAKLQQDAPVTKLPLRWVYVSAAVMMAVLFINIKAWQSPGRSQQTSGLQQVMQEYGFGGNDFYSMNYSR